MDDRAVVCGGEAACDIHRVSNRPRPRQGYASQMLAQSQAVEQLRHHIGRGVQSTDVMNDENIWMIQRARRSRLLLETAESIGIAANVGRQYFDRHLAAEPAVRRPIHFAHAACADWGEHFVRAETSP